MSARGALVVGATGLVGSWVLRVLAADSAFSPVVALTRRALPHELALPGVEAVLVNFGDLETCRHRCRVDSVFCALGTTIRQAGSRARFRQVDYGYALAVARLAREEGARHLLLVSALGADAGSRIFYNRVKGELESAVRALGFPSLTIARPSLLLGDRGEFRLGEEIGKRVAFLVPAKYKPVEARAVAETLVRAAREARPGVSVVESTEIRAVG